MRPSQLDSRLETWATCVRVDEDGEHRHVAVRRRKLRRRQLADGIEDDLGIGSTDAVLGWRESKGHQQFMDWHFCDCQPCSEPPMCTETSRWHNNVFR